MSISFLPTCLPVQVIVLAQHSEFVYCLACPLLSRSLCFAITPAFTNFSLLIISSPLHISLSRSSKPSSFHFNCHPLNLSFHHSSHVDSSVPHSIPESSRRSGNLDNPQSHSSSLILSPSTSTCYSKIAFSYISLDLYLCMVNVFPFLGLFSPLATLIITSPSSHCYHPITIPIAIGNDIPISTTLHKL